MKGKSPVDAKGGYYDYDISTAALESFNKKRISDGKPVIPYHPNVQLYAGTRAYEDGITQGKFSSKHLRPGGESWQTVDPIRSIML